MTDKSHTDTLAQAAPVAFQYRFRDDAGEWTGWMSCGKDHFDAIERYGEIGHCPAECRGLYAAQPPAAPVHQEDACAAAAKEYNAEHFPSSAATEGETKTVYVKRWRTLVKLPAKYADEIVAALRVPDEPQTVPLTPGKSDMLDLSKRIETGLKADDGGFFAPPLSRKQWWMIASSLDYAARFDVPQSAATGEEFLPRDAWSELVHKDDRTSPEEYPDMCLISFDELKDYMERHTPALSRPDRS